MKKTKLKKYSKIIYSHFNDGKTNLLYKILKKQNRDIIRFVITCDKEKYLAKNYKLLIDEKERNTLLDQEIYENAIYDIYFKIFNLLKTKNQIIVN